MSDDLRDKVTEALFWIKRSESDFDIARETIVTLVEAYALQVAIGELEKLTEDVYGFYVNGFDEGKFVGLGTIREAINRLKGESNG